MAAVGRDQLLELEEVMQMLEGSVYAPAAVMRDYACKLHEAGYDTVQSWQRMTEEHNIP